MFHFFIKPTIHIDCFTDINYVFNNTPIVKGHDFLPEWWKKHPKTLTSPFGFPEPTIKTCVGVQGYFANSLVLPLWSDLFIRKTEDMVTWQFADKLSSAEGHSKEQFSGFLNPQHAHLKLISPWFFRTKEDLNWLMLEPTYNMDSLTEYSILQGVLNFKHVYSTNVQMMTHLTSTKPIIIPVTTPIAMFKPLSDRKIVHHNHLITGQEMGLLRNKGVRLSFINAYRKQVEIQKCPFNWRNK